MISFNPSEFGEFLGKHDMIYERPPEEWERGLPMGNSVASSVVWGGNPIVVTLGRNDIWETRTAFKPNKDLFRWKNFCKKFEQGRGEDVRDFYQTEAGPTPQQIPLGRFELKLEGKEIRDYHMRLHLHDGVATGGFSSEFGTIEWRSYVSSSCPVVVFDYRLAGNEKASLRFRFVSKLGEYTDDMALAVETGASCRTKKNMGMFITGYENGVPEMAQVLKDWGYDEPVFGSDELIQYYVQSIPENGDYAVAWTEIAGRNGRNVIVACIMTDRIHGHSKDLAVEQVQKIRTLEQIDRLEQENCSFWHDFYPKSFLSIPDTKLEGFYWIQMYILGCTARHGGNPMTIGGVWTPDDGLAAFCANDFHWNMQQQGNLWPIYTSNRLECGSPTYDLIQRSRPNLSKFCQDFFGCDGQFLTHCSDLDCKPLYINQDQFEFCSLPWMCLMFWQHYRYSMDQQFLRDRVYPLMRDAVRPLIHDLVQESDGTLHLPWTSSPEYHGPQETYRFALSEEPDWGNRFGPDATIDVAFLRFLCESLLETVGLLALEDSEANSWHHTLDHLAPYKLDRFGGLMVRGDLALTSSHRHFSHLFPIHPLHQITYDQPEGKAIIDNSLMVISALGHGEWMGWSFPQMAAICIRAERISLARMILMDYVDKIINENTFHMQGMNHRCELMMHENYGMTVEGSLMAASGIMDFACCSFGGEIRVFYYAPDAWDEACFWNFRTEGAFLVSARRKNSRTQFIQVVSEVGGRCRIHTDLQENFEITSCGKTVDFEVVDKRIIFDTRPGCVYLLSDKNTKSEDLTIQPVPGHAYEENYFGLKKKSRY